MEAGRPIRTTCPYCGVGCGVLATPDGAGGAEITGDPEHPANFGRLCSKGSALGETLGLDDRLLRPTIAGAPASWGDAIARTADAFSTAIRDHGPDSVAFYVSGQLLTEDYYVANKLMKGFIGSANIDTNSRLCMASSVAGHRTTFGADTVPGLYADLEKADVIVLVGSNLAWCHPVLYQRIQAAKARRENMLVVNIDPRRTSTSEIADLDLAIKPGSDVALFAGLLAAIERRGAIDWPYLRHYVDGHDAALDSVRALDLHEVARATGLTAERAHAFYDIWIANQRVVTIYSQGVNQSAEGTRKVQAILNCHLATGRIGKPGMGPFSVTGQPNAMGGREVGGLANMLAAHLDLEQADHRAAVQDFWKSPTIAAKPGLKAVDLFRACGDGRIKALWVMATNPVVSMPDADAVRGAIEATPFVAVSDVSARSETADLADVLFPATAWGEKSGTVTNSERRISRQRPFMPPPGDTRPDWRIIADVAAGMGFADAFDYPDAASVFREHAALSAVAGALGRDFDIGALKDLDAKAYDEMAPTLWPASTTSRPRARFFAQGGFFTQSRRARMHATRPADAAPPSLAYRLNTGRTRDHWHTMTRTGKSPRLGQHIAEPFLEIHPADAQAIGLEAAGLAQIENDRGAAILRVLVSARAHRGAPFAPMHWGRAFASGGVGALASAEVDPTSGQPELKGGQVRIRPFKAAWQGFAVTRAEPTPETAYWAKSRAAAGWRLELADAEQPQDWGAFARSLFRADPDAEIASVTVSGGVGVRIAVLQDGEVQGVLLTDRKPVAAARAFVIDAFAAGAAAGVLLAGRPPGDAPDPGATVCSCFGVGVNSIVAAIAEQGLESVEAIGEALDAGTNCGSCRPELRVLMDSMQRAAAE